MADRIARALVPGHQLLAVACVSTEVAREARRRHSLAPSSAAFLGKGLCAGLMLATLQKNEQHKVNLQIGCDGPLKGLFVDATPAGDVRGYVHNHDVNFPPEPRFTDGPSLGRDGYLAVLRERDGEFYRGSVALENSDLTLDLEHYYRQSEQTPTTLQIEAFSEGEDGLGWVGGVLIQRMPGGDDEALEALRARLRSGVVEEAVRGGQRTVHALLAAVFGSEELELIADQEVRFQCPCSQARVLRALGTLNAQELREMIAEDGKAEVDCDFCGAHYSVSGDELRELLAGVEARSDSRS